MVSKEIALRAVKAALDRKAEDPVMLDMRKVSNFCDYFVILSGSSLRKTKAIAEGIADSLEKEKIKPLSAEHIQESSWLLLDFGSVIVHVFYAEAREFYALERLWQDAKKVRIPKK